MNETFQKYGKISIFGKRILHVASPVRWKGSKYEVERCSNWKVMMDTVNFLPMCHHYIMIPERNTLSSSDKLYSMENVTIIPFPYPQSVMQNRANFDGRTFCRIFSGRQKVEFRPGEFITLHTSSIDIDFVFCHQPEILTNVLWNLLSLRYGMNNTDSMCFFHWVDCNASSPAPLFPPTFFRQFEAIDRCSKIFFHSDMSSKYLMSNFGEKNSHVLVPDEKILMNKIAKMPLKAKPLPQTNGEYWSPPEGKKIIAFNHRWNDTTGARQLHKMMEGLPKEYQVLVTDEKVKKPLSGYSPIKTSKLEELEEGQEKSVFEPSRFKYAYEGIPTSRLGSMELYSDFLRGSYASVAWIKGYATWNLSVQDPIQVGTPTLVYDSPMMREVLGDNYPLYFKTKGEFQQKLQNLPNNFSYNIPKHDAVFRDNLVQAMMSSWQHTKMNKEGSFCKSWLYFILNGLEYKKDFLYQTHPILVDGQGGNSWETIRRWCLQFGLKDDPTSRHTRLFIPDDTIKEKMIKHLEGFDSSEIRRDENGKLEKHKVFHSELNKTKVRSTLT
ncbi:MAG: hypothetical protein QGH83_14175, partial [Candidatus Pacebacteria bacterium]|nr:hypothetical protein [Candidatus Paceibacterota bacterium]